MRTRGLRILALWCVAALGVSCSPSGAPTALRQLTDTSDSVATVPQQSEAQESAGVLRIGFDTASLGTLDPHQAAGSQDRAVVDMIFNGLLRYVPGQAPLIEPDLALEIPEPETVDGSQVWTFQLRPGVLCHPGPHTAAYELDADDVVYSLQRSADPERSAYAGEYEGITVEKIDQRTVQITVQPPLSPHLFLPKLTAYAGGFIVCRQAVEAAGDDAFQGHPVGTGPFMFESYTPQDRLRLVANPHYYRGRPRLSAVEVFYQPEIANREQALRSGTLDVITGLNDGTWLEHIQQEPDLVVDRFGPGEVVTLYFNTGIAPLDDIRVRQAIVHALDRDAFIAPFGEQVAVPVYSPVPDQLLPGGLTQGEVQDLGLAYATDLERARELLAEAGYPDGFALTVFSSEMRAYRLSYESLQSQLAEIGIRLTVNVMEHATMHRLIREDVNPLVIYVAWRPNANIYLNAFFHSRSIVMTGASPDTNFSHYGAVDGLIEAARRETDPAQQVQLWKHAQVRILSDLAAYPLLYLNQNYVRRASVNYGHPLVTAMALYPQITEATWIAP